MKAILLQPVYVNALASHFNEAASYAKEEFVSNYKIVFNHTIGLTHWGLEMYIVDTGLINALLPDGIKPLSKPILTYPETRTWATHFNFEITQENVFWKLYFKKHIKFSQWPLS